jgi:hopene-associated glycosyltransferase HpnB
LIALGLNALGVVLCAVWLAILFRLYGHGSSFAAVLSASGPPQPNVTAVIPARNEAAVVARSLESLAGQCRIVLVDDNSSDGTGATAQRYAEVVRGSEPPAGWTGKLWAVSQGVAQAGASSNYLLLTDADIVHSPGNVASLVERAQSGGYDLVSYMVELRCESLAERALIPAFVFFFFLLYPPAQIRNPRSKTAGAAGGCILIRREMLEGAGGIAAIRGELIDDCALARIVKNAGGRIWLGASRSAVSIREYDTFGEVGRMISRTAFTQLRYSAIILAGTVAGLAFVYLLPPSLAVVGNPYGAAAWLLMTAAYFPAIRLYRRSPLWAPLLPLVAVFYMSCTMASAIQYWRGRGGAWKGRSQAQRRP